MLDAGSLETCSGRIGTWMKPPLTSGRLVEIKCIKA